MSTFRRKLYIFIVVLIVFILTSLSCNISFGNASTPEVSRVGPDGSEIDFNSGVKVIVPQGTLKEEVDLEVGPASEKHPAPKGATPLGETYAINLPAGTELLFPLEVYLPLERKSNINDNQYTAMRWDGDHWTSMAGRVEGNVFHFTTNHTTLYRIHYWEAAGYPVEFYNLSGTKVRVWPWLYETFLYDGGLGYTWVADRNAQGITYGGRDLPPGVYTDWCVDWSEFTEPVWDIFGGGYWNKFVGNFNFVFSSPITLNRYSEYEFSQPNTAEVSFSIGAASPGLCGQAPSLGQMNPSNPAREQVPSWVQLPPAGQAPGQSNKPPAGQVPGKSNNPPPAAAHVDWIPYRDAYWKKIDDLRTEHQKENCAKNKNYSGCYEDIFGMPTSLRNYMYSDYWVNVHRSYVTFSQSLEDQLLAKLGECFDQFIANPNNIYNLDARKGEQSACIKKNVLDLGEKELVRIRDTSCRAKCGEEGKTGVVEGMPAICACK